MPNDAASLEWCMNMLSGRKRCGVACSSCLVAEQDAECHARHAEWIKKMRSGLLDMLSGRKRCGVSCSSCLVAEQDAECHARHA